MSEQVREIDRALRGLAQQHAALDAEELLWLRRAQAQNIWPKLGYVHGLEYLEDVFAYAPRTAKERLRVARELGELPQIEAALARGELKFCVVRELTRVADTANEGVWLERARGQRLRAVEQLVAGRKKGDGPDTPPDPKRIKHHLSLELDGESLAAWRQLRAVIEGELGEKLDDRALVLELAYRIVSSTGALVAADHAVCAGEACSCSDEQGEAEQACAGEAGGCDHEAEAHTGSESSAADAERVSRRSVRPRYMVHIMKCPECHRAWQNGAGTSIEIAGNALAHVECDAVIVDEENGERATWTIPPATKRKVIARDQWRCQVPGCRAAHFLDVHHIIHRALGGTNDKWNLLVLCSGHHRLHHDGLLEISGRAPDQLRFVRDGVELLPPGKVPAHVRLMGDARSASNRTVDDAKLALTTLGFKAPIAKRAVELACARAGTDVGLDRLIREALRHC